MTTLHAQQHRSFAGAARSRRSLRELVSDALSARRYTRAVGSNRSMRSLRAEFDRRGGQPGTLRFPAE